MGRDNLPAEVNGFVGRRRELSQVRCLLQKDRLVTLTGPGGVGKTRLALRAAARARPAFGDGVWLAELAAVADPGLVAATVADVFGVADRAAGSVLSALISHLENRRLLLVLDNCEHVVDVCASLVDKLLAAAPGVRILATSRAPLRVGGEQVVSVPPLSAPDQIALPPGDLSEFDAVRLFTERGRTVRPEFAVTDASRAAVAGVCQRLDGIPLAIELAAAWLRVLSAEQILVRLDDQLRLLTKGPRNAPARHQTLRAALDWSHDLCSAEEQVLWARASVFAGGFDLAAAEAVCGGDGIETSDVFGLITGLVDKSILAALLPMPGPTDGMENPATRYGLLDTVRQYGRERLAASGREPVLRARHRDYYHRLAQRARAERVSAGEVAWLLRLRREHPNLRLAMEFALAGPAGAETAVEIAVAAQDLWLGAGRYQEGQRWLIRALAGYERPTAVRASALALAATLTELLGDTEAGGRMRAEASALADRLADPATQAAVALHRSMAMVWVRPPDLGQARELAERALAGARAAGDLRLASLSLIQATTIALLAGDPRAGSYAAGLRTLGETHDAEWTTSWGHLMLALVHWQDGDHRQAVALARPVLRVFRLVHDAWGAGTYLSILAWNAAATGRHQQAARLLGACHAIRHRAGTPLAELDAFAEHQARCERDTRDALGERTFPALFSEGSHFTLDEAVRHAFMPLPMPGPPDGMEDPGVPSRAAAAPAGRGPLTRRETQIAGLVADGLTDRDIAARLVISRRTAESHVEHILGKLGFTGRAQIAGWVTGRNRSGPPRSAES